MTEVEMMRSRMLILAAVILFLVKEMLWHFGRAGWRTEVYTLSLSLYILRPSSKHLANY